MKAKRQEKILEIIASESIETQEQLLAALRSAGMNVTQATISRDIKELHLIKEQTGRGSYHYAVSVHKETFSNAGRLRTIFRESVSSFDCAQNLVVLKTLPGLASAACMALDNMHISVLVGSLAGGDTVLLVMRDNESALAFCEGIRKMIE